MPAATFPGTVTPLRGLMPFAESERDVFFGRDKERDDLAHLVTTEGFRAGLLYGEPGVGKTSLLRAGLIPHLRDHGVIALSCEDIFNPMESFAQSLTAATGQAPRDKETAAGFLARVVGEAMQGQLYLFIVDDVDAALATEDEAIISQYGDLFARVVTRSSGRARFLFACASERAHYFGALERRTGSLFPPSSRFYLKRFLVTDAASVLDKTLALAGVVADQVLAQEIAQNLGQAGPILPADIQIAALSVRELQITNLEGLQRIGGAGELQREWLENIAAATGNKRSALRLVAELAPTDKLVPYSPDWVATRASIDPAFARHALEILRDRGVVRPIAIHGAEEFHYSLTHEILCRRVREIAAPAKESARRAFELLGSKAAEGKRLSAAEWWAVKREGLSPSTPAERNVLDRTKRFAMIVAGIAAAVPLILLIFIYTRMSGNYYLDVARGASGQPSIVVRSGRPGYGSFEWMPSSPSFGDVVADTGFTESMVDPEKWKAIVAHDITGELDDGEYVEQAYGALDPAISNLIKYASSGSETSLELMNRGVEGPADIARLLVSLHPVSRGSGPEIALVEQALLDASPAVQTAALGVAVETARRRPGAYAQTLANALASDNDELRRLAFSRVRSLGRSEAAKLFQAALDSDPSAAAQRELQSLVSSGAAASANADSALSLLQSSNITQAARERARSMLRRAFASNPATATLDIRPLIQNERAPPEETILALELVLEYSPKETYEELVDSVSIALRARDEGVRAAALPVLARVSPETAAGELALMTENPGLSSKLKVAAALAWGELARRGEKGARAALESLLKETDNAVRAAAARAYGNVGRSSQTQLIKMVKNERFSVALGAAYGLANSSEVGASTSVALGGILQLWKRKGKSRRAATKVMSRIARKRPNAVISYLTTASRSTEDASLHSLGVIGLCNAMTAKHRDAPRGLTRAADDKSVEVRRLVIQCVVDNPKQTATATRIAKKLANDPDAEIRREVARVLSNLQASGSGGKKVGSALIKLAQDRDRSVRMIAIRALAAMGADAPEEAKDTLPGAFDRGTEADKLVVLEAAQALGAAELVQLAIADESALVRIAAIDTAIATNTSVGVILSSALTDPDPGLRRAALERIASGDTQLDAQSIDNALTLALRDSDEAISDLAFETYARVGDPEKVQLRLKRALRERSERVRSQAARACRGLAVRDPKAALELLEPLLHDASNDVRAAMLPSLATAYAAVYGIDTLTEMLANSEREATQRLVTVGAFVVLSQTEEGGKAALVALEQAGESGPPLGRIAAQLGAGLIVSSADGLEFLSWLVP